MKFGRTYVADIEVGGGSVLQIEYPLTMTFDVVRNTLGSANRGHFRFYNLKPDTRRQIFHDRNETLSFRRIKVQAGYEDQSPLPQIFVGNIMQAYSYREGVNWVTEIEAFDGGFGILNGQVAQTVPAGWNLKQILGTAIGSMQNVSMGAVGDVEVGSTRGVTLLGNSWSVINNLISGKNTDAFIDGEVANVLNDDEVLAGANGIALLSADTGLLQTPRRSNQLLEATVLFEPRLRVGQRLALQSLEAVYNGTYKCIGISHRGTISGAVGGECTSVASLNLGAFTFKDVN